MRNLLNWVLRVVVVLLVGISSMLITMRLAIHGREVPMPKFVGLSAQEANKVADDNGLALILESRFFSNDVPEGRVLSQVPQPGVKVRRGWRVRIAESLGPQRNVIPNVLGESPRAAELNVRRRGLTLGSVAELPIAGKTPGEVIAQSPPADARGIAAPKVSVLIAAPPEEQAFVMPELVGMRLEDAKSAIAAAGFKLGKITGASNSTAVVVHQSPAIGQRVVAGSTINLEAAHP